MCHGKHTHKAEFPKWMAPSALEKWWHCVLCVIFPSSRRPLQLYPHGYNSNFTCHLNFSHLPLKTEEYVVLELLNNINVSFSNYVVENKQAGWPTHTTRLISPFFITFPFFPTFKWWNCAIWSFLFGMECLRYAGNAAAHPTTFRPSTARHPS